MCLFKLTDKGRSGCARRALLAAMLVILVAVQTGPTLAVAAPSAQGDGPEVVMDDPPALGPTPAPPIDRGAAVQEVLRLVNAERAKVGAAPVTLNDQLGKAAQDYAALMAQTGCFDHECPPVTDFNERARIAGYNGSQVGENIAVGQSAASLVVSVWMESPGHRENILNQGYKELGVGVVDGGFDSDIYWVQVFGAP